MQYFKFFVRKITLEDLQMLSFVTLYCQVTKIVMDSGSQFSELLSVSQMSQVTIKFCLCHYGQVVVRSWLAYSYTIFLYCLGFEI